MAPEGVSVHVGRVLLVDTRTFSDPPHPDDATALLAALPMQAIVFHPPWFADDEQQLGVGYFQRQGFDVVYANQMHLRGLAVAKPTDPLRTFTELYPAELYAFARSEVPAAAEAVFFAGNGFRAIGMIAALEEDLGRPVLTGKPAGVRQSTDTAACSGH
jgi:maleate isomerase